MDPACTEPGFITRDKKGVRGGDAKSSLFAPVYMSECVPSILQTVNDNMTLAKTKSITEHSHMMIGKVSLPDMT